MTILTMAGSTGLDVVAEGIETHEQSDLLRLLGCRYGQGFHFSRPVPSDEVDLRGSGRLG